MAKRMGNVQRTAVPVQRSEVSSSRATTGRPSVAAGSVQSSLFRSGGPVFSLGAPLQAKVTIGPVSDQYEQEADSTADRVLSGQTVQQVSLLSGGFAGTANAGVAQRATPEEDKFQAKFIQRAGLEDEKLQAKFIQRAGLEDEKLQAKFIQRAGLEDEKLQAKFIQRDGLEDEKFQAKFIQRSMESVAADALSGKGPGSALSPSTAGTFQRAFGADLSHVRVHDDPSSQQAAASLGARAFTNANHIWLGPGESQSDQKLMAHEVTHVFQQGAAAPGTAPQQQAPGPTR